MNIKVEKDQGKRVDLVFSEYKPNLTRSTIKQLFVEGVIKVNGQQVFPNYKVKIDDTIEFESEEITKYLNNSTDTLKPFKLDLKVIYEDQDLLVINKPYGISSHPDTKSDNESLLNAIYYYLEQSKQKITKIRLVNRLDKETSGVILATKNLEAHDFYSKLFEKREVKKVYYAVVSSLVDRNGGQFEDKSSKALTVTNYLTEKIDGKVRIVNSSKDGRLAKTNIFFEGYINLPGIGQSSLLRVEPQTGRQHQIRVHLASFGYPIVGDKLYGGQTYKRMMLHAYSVIFNQGGKQKKIVANLPNEFTN